ncbi:dof zinc finger protein DOF4.6-like [Punica granatum]|uniref:Dof zinc finger protein n=2 Tax=Punica granatum TaxID=22663 RepID=A0A218WJH4_PUNGR|nr:dof zinc finger protein DOF4.6-like [Punica granatum]OWM72192.1 hypothetical protein CDL15_Pgr018076 [Punica granatum]PKI36748.1 hypothetical protein CRG98_042878 [Punica granatum]
MDTAQWPQEIVVKPLEEIVVPIPNTTTLCAPKQSGSTSTGNSNGVERKPRPQKEQALNCPRCNSTNTKFCYYNNYSLTQPRYFCKTCRRYWTEGGSLRNIPVGGGSRKNKGRPSSSACSTSSTSTSTSSSSAPPPMINPLLDPHHMMSASKMRVSSSSAATAAAMCNGQNPSKGQGQDLSLGSSLELLNSKGLLSSFMSMPLSVSHDPSGVYTPPPPHGLFPGFQDMKPASGLGFSLDGMGGGFRSALQDSAGNMDNGGGRLLFPFEELKQTNDSVEHHQDNRSGDNHQHQQQQQASDHHHHPNGFWSGILGGGSW